MSLLSTPSHFILTKRETYLIEWRIRPQAKRIIIRLHPQKNTTLIIILPTPRAKKKAEALLVYHKNWIEKQFELTQKNKINFKPGCFIPFCGEKRQLLHDPQKRFGVMMHDQYIYCAGDEVFFSRRIRDYLKQRALIQFHSLLDEFLPLLKIPPIRLCITDTTSRWGSCSSKRIIRLSWRLILAPIFVQHYVLAHELAHLTYMNHSLVFWKYLETLTSYKKAATTWLKKYGLSLLQAN